MMQTDLVPVELGAKNSLLMSHVYETLHILNGLS